MSYTALLFAAEARDEAGGSGYRAALRHDVTQSGLLCFRQTEGLAQRAYRMPVRPATLATLQRANCLD